MAARKPPRLAYKNWIFSQFVIQQGGATFIAGAILLHFLHFINFAIVAKSDII